MYAEGDIFIIKNKEYMLRLINTHLVCWLEPVLYRGNMGCFTGGLNEAYHMDDLWKLEYTGIRY